MRTTLSIASLRFTYLSWLRYEGLTASNWPLMPTIKRAAFLAAIVLTGIFCMVVINVVLGLIIVTLGLCAAEVHRRTRAQVDAQTRDHQREYEMTKGSITKLVGTFGSQWGRIRPVDSTRDIFFNTASLDESVVFATLGVGQDVAFDELPDHVNGSHAENVVLEPAASPVNVRVS